MSADQQSLTGEQIKVVAVDFGGYAVAFRLSQWCSKDRLMTCCVFSILDGSHGLLARGHGHYAG
jgi:hypothetical protein